tara:strand:+ start:1042 stop:1224 length:183 start_codon:yes stop_codon:yes gene_type:complete
METKKTEPKKKNPVIQENIVTNLMFRHSDITHGSWNYSENTENTNEDEIKIKHETLNFSM